MHYQLTHPNIYSMHQNHVPKNKEERNNISAIHSDQLFENFESGSVWKLEKRHEPVSVTIICGSGIV